MNKTVFEKNMEELEKISKRSTDFIKDRLKEEESGKIRYKEIEENDQTFMEKGLGEDIEIEVETAYNGEPVFRVKKDEFHLYLSGKREPGRIADLWTDRFEKLPRTAPIILFGIGDGSFLKEINRKVKTDVKIFVYEPSLKIFIKCLENTDLTDVFKNREIVFGIDNNISYDEIRTICSDMLNMVNLEFLCKCILPGYSQLYPKEAKKFFSIVFDYIQIFFTNHATRSDFSNIIMATLLYNAIYIPDSYITPQLVNVIPRDIPAIVVAAGPSLNKSMEDLKKAKDKAFIIAVDTAIRPLLKEGIIPDMFAVVDASKPVDLVQTPGAEMIPLVTSLYGSQELLAYHEGKKFFFEEGNFFVNKIYADMNVDFKPVNSGGSVATMAFSLAYMIGIDTIILVGQDLALTDNKSHADGTFEEKMPELDTSGFKKVPGNLEELVPIRGDFENYLKWYNRYIVKCKKHRPAFRAINSTAGGAKIDEAEYMPLDEAIKEFCHKEINLKERIAELKPVFSEEQRPKVIQYLHDTEPGFRKIADNAIKQKKLYQKIDNMCNTGNISPKEYEKLLKKLRKLSKETLSSPLYQMIDNSLIDASLIMQKELLLEENSLVEEGKELARKGLLYMDLVNQCANLLADVSAASVSAVV